MRYGCYIGFMEADVNKANRDLEKVLDQYTLKGGLSLKAVKATRNDDGNEATTWSFYSANGYLFRAMTYVAAEANEAEPVPYLFVGLYLGNIESIADKQNFYEFLLNTNMTIFDPIRLSKDENEIVLSLRSRSDKVACDYIETLLPVMNYVAEQFLVTTSERFDFVPLVDSINSQKRMVQ